MALPSELHVGDKVKCSAEYTYDGKTHLASFVRVNTYDVIQIGGRNLPDDRIVIGIGKAVTAAVKASELTIISSTAAKPAPAPAPAPPTPPPEPAPSSSDILSSALENAKKSNPELKSTNPGSGGGALMPETREGVSSEGTYAEYYGVYDSQKPSSMTSDELTKIEQGHPSVIQNGRGHPYNKGFDSGIGRYRYDYYQDYQRDGLLSGLVANTSDDAIRRSVNIDVMSRGELVRRYATQYNKFKLLNPNDVLAHSHAHVFFVRPDCNILVSPDELEKQIGKFSEFFYAFKKNPFLLQELTQLGSGYNHELGLFLSNKARSFEISDEYITSGDYGESLTGFKVPFGKSNAESQAGGKFSITYNDDRDLHIYQLHKLWTSYISYVYRGKVYPRLNYIMTKIIDYSCCLYYFLTAEDGETIIFWSKYWGVFPLEAPSSGFSYTLDNAGGIFNPELKLEYQFAWKEDFNPLTLIEFNTHTRNLPFKYVPNYQASKVGTGYTWAGPPFVETLDGKDGLSIPYTFKLRFRPNSVNTASNTTAASSGGSSNRLDGVSKASSSASYSTIY